MAKFSKAHYEAIAEEMRLVEEEMDAAINQMIGDPDSLDKSKLVLEVLRQRLVNRFIRDNRRFNPVKFRLASTAKKRK